MLVIHLFVFCMFLCVPNSVGESKTGANKGVGESIN